MKLGEGRLAWFGVIENGNWGVLIIRAKWLTVFNTFLFWVIAQPTNHLV
jgi:hypothetical protein